LFGAKLHSDLIACSRDCAHSCWSPVYEDSFRL